MAPKIIFMSERQIKYFLYAAILAGIIFRILILNSYIFEDEGAILVGGMKFFHHSYRDGLAYVEHPPVAMFLAGLPSVLVESDYKTLEYASPGFYWFIYIHHKAIGDNLLGARLSTITAGILSIAFIFLIAKNLFGKMAGLWAAALASLSADFIFYSVHTFMEIYMIFFSAVSIYIYLKFLDERGKKKWLIGFLLLFFLMMEIGTRGFNALFLPLTLPIAYIFMKRKFDEQFFSVLLVAVVSVTLTYLLIWPPEFHGRIFEVNKPGATLGVSFAQEIIGIFSRNSYIFSFSMVLAIVGIFRLIKFGRFLQKIRGRQSIILIFFIISFIVLGTTNLSSYGIPFMRYILVLFLPLCIAGGLALSRFSQNRAILFVSVLLVIASAASIFILLPNHLQEHNNFNFQQYALYPSNEIEKTENEMKYLHENGNPPVMTNEPNILLFYKGDILMATAPTLDYCGVGDQKKVRNGNITIIHRFFNPSVNETRKDASLCPLISVLNFRRVNKINDDSIFVLNESYDSATIEKAARIKNFLKQKGRQPILTNNNALMFAYIDSGLPAYPAAYKNDVWCSEVYFQFIMKFNPLLVIDAQTGNHAEDFCTLSGSEFEGLIPIEGFYVFGLGNTSEKS